MEDHVILAEVRNFRIPMEANALTLDSRAFAVPI